MEISQTFRAELTREEIEKRARELAPGVVCGMIEELSSGLARDATHGAFGQMHIPVCAQDLTCRLGYELSNDVIKSLLPDGACIISKSIDPPSLNLIVEFTQPVK